MGIAHLSPLIWWVMHDSFKAQILRAFEDGYSDITLVRASGHKFPSIIRPCYACSSPHVRPTETLIGWAIA